MKKLLLLVLVSGALDLCAMEINESPKSEDLNLPGFVQEFYEPSEMQEKKTPDEIDAENKKIINLFNLFAGIVNEMNAEDRAAWCFSMQMFTTDLMLQRANVHHAGFSELQTMFCPMKNSKKRQWQQVINNSFGRMDKESTCTDNCFSEYVKEYLKADIIVPLLVNTFCKIKKVKIDGNQQNELLGELMRLYKQDEELNALLAPAPEKHDDLNREKLES